VARRKTGGAAGSSAGSECPGSVHNRRCQWAFINYSRLGKNKINFGKTGMIDSNPRIWEKSRIVQISLFRNLVRKNSSGGVQENLPSRVRFALVVHRCVIGVLQLDCAGVLTMRKEENRR